MKKCIHQRTSLGPRFFNAKTNVKKKYNHSHQALRFKPAFLDEKQ